MRDAGHHLGERAVLLRLHLRGERPLLEFLAQHAAARFADGARELAHHAFQQGRRVGQQPQEGLAPEYEDLAGFERQDVGRPLPAIEQRHLAIGVAGAGDAQIHFGIVTRPLVDAQPAGEHHVQAVRSLPLPEDDLPCRQPPRGAGGGQEGRLGLRQAAEGGNAQQRVGDGLHACSIRCAPVACNPYGRIGHTRRCLRYLRSLPGGVPCQGSNLVAVGALRCGPSDPRFDALGIGEALQQVRRAVHIVFDPREPVPRLGLALDGEARSPQERAGDDLALVATLGPTYPEWLGDRSLQRGARRALSLRRRRDGQRHRHRARW